MGGDVICPNPECLGSIDCSDPTLDCGQHDEQETLLRCPYCDASLVITTHISYSAELHHPVPAGNSVALPPPFSPEGR